MGFPRSIIDSESFELELNGSAWDTSGLSFGQIPSVVLVIRFRPVYSQWLLRSSAVTVPGAAGSLGAASSESAVGRSVLPLGSSPGSCVGEVWMADVRFVCVISVSECPVSVPAPPGVFLPVLYTTDVHHRFPPRCDV